MSTLYADRTRPNTGHWQDKHDDAIRTSRTYPRSIPFQQPMVDILKAWEQHALDHKDRYESLIGDDGVIGAHWESMGDALRGLLNGETGRLDCGTLDGFILDTMKSNGIDVSSK